MSYLIYTQRFCLASLEVFSANLLHVVLGPLRESLELLEQLSPPCQVCPFMIP